MHFVIVSLAAADRGGSASGTGAEIIFCGCEPVDDGGAPGYWRMYQHCSASWLASLVVNV